MKYLVEKSYFVWLIAIITFIISVYGIGNVHLFDWDEINFAESAREMIISKNWLQVQINFQPFYEKPAGFIWSQAASMMVFGINEFGARFPNTIIAVLSMLSLWFIGQDLKDKTFACWWIVGYMCSMLPAFYFKTGLIDPGFNLFIFLGVYFFYKSLTTQSNWNYPVSGGLAIGLAVLFKGPVGLLLFTLTTLAYLILSKKIKVLQWSQIGLFSVTFVITIFFWYGINVIHYGFEFVDAFVQRHFELFSTHDAGHKGFPGYHIIVLLVGCFPISLFAIPKIFTKQKINLNFQQLMVVLLVVVVLLFEVVQTKIVHYSSLAYYPISFLAACYIYEVVNKGYGISKVVKYSLFSVGVIWCIVAGLLVFIGVNSDLIVSYISIKDPFALANLEADVSWNYSLLGAPILLLIGLILWLKESLKLKQRFFYLFGSSFLFLHFILIFFVPNIEKHTQFSAIEFYKSKMNEEVKLSTFGFKSYAHHFYSKQRSGSYYGIKKDDPVGSIVVCRIDKADRFEREHPNYVKLNEINGFVFFELR